MVEATETTRSGSDRTAVLAGNGRLPELLARELRQSGHEPFCVSMDGEAGGWISQFGHVGLKSIEIGRLVRALKTNNVNRIVLAGGIRARPSLWFLRPDWVTLTNLWGLYKALGKGDDALLRSVIEMLEEQGFEVAGAQDIIPDLIAPIGVLTKTLPTQAQARDRDLAFEAALSLGRRDAGQAAIAAAGEIVAVEDARGTDAMLAGVKVSHGNGVLAKVVKPQQDHRADLPSIGPETVDNAARAGACGHCSERRIVVDT